MNPWATVWASIISASLLVFAAVALIVAIGGFFDVRAMFRRITEQHGTEPGPDADGQA